MERSKRLRRRMNMIEKKRPKKLMKKRSKVQYNFKKHSY